MDLLVVGTVAFDKIETPFGKTEKILGGAATYIGLAASFSDVHSGLVSVVGNDFPEEYIRLLQDRNVDTKGIEKDPNGKTFFWEGKYHEDMNARDTLNTELNVLENFKPVIPEEYKNADILMLGNLHPSIQMDVLNQMNEKPKLVVLDTMNFWMDIARKELDEVIQKIDVLTINDEEARLYTGEYSLVKAAAKIMKDGLKYLIIKKGEHGALFFHDKDIFFAPAMPLSEVFDPTGAGDTFAGGFCGYLAETKNIDPENLKRAIIYGSAMASFVVEKFGAERLLTLTPDELENRLEGFERLTQYEFER